MAKQTRKPTASAARDNLGFEAKLWAAADALGNSMDAAEYKHVVLGLIFLRAPQPTIGPLVDDALAAIERDNPTHKGVLPKDYARPGLDKQRLGQIINLVSDITLGRVYECFVSRLASAEGKSSGQFYTPSHVVRALVEMLAPYKGRVYDPRCGSGGMFVQSEKFIEAQTGRHWRVPCMT
jgi:type I restriction enzyme M protein